MLKDVVSPGFACLSTALRKSKRGEIDQETVARYQDALIPRLQEGRNRLGQLVVPASVTACVSPLLSSAESMFDKLQFVLELVEDYLHDGCGKSLDEAISTLDVLQEQFGRVF